MYERRTGRHDLSADPQRLAAEPALNDSAANTLRSRGGGQPRSLFHTCSSYQRMEPMMNGSLLAQLSLLVVAAAVSARVGSAARREVPPPPNAPARVEYRQASGALALDYHGTRILSATVTAQASDGTKVPGAVKMESSVAPGEKVEQRLKFVLAKPQIPHIAIHKSHFFHHQSPFDEAKMEKRGNK